MECLVVKVTFFFLVCFDGAVRFTLLSNVMLGFCCSPFVEKI
jgi:hypothetical protein